MSDAILWMHDEMLSATWLQPERPTVFVFDDAWLASEQVALQRIVFMYECLLELPQVELRRGDVVAEVRAFAAEHGAEDIVTVGSPLPRIQRQGAALGVTWIDPEPIVELPPSCDLRRFSRYWKHAERQLLR